MDEKLIKFKADIHDLEREVFWAKLNAMMAETLEDRMQIAGDILEKVSTKLEEWDNGY